MKKWSLALLPLLLLSFASCDIFGGKIEAPNLSSPADGAEVSSTPTLSWSSVEGAAGYKVEIDDADDFESPVVTKEVTETSYTVETPLDTGTYYWRVATKDENDKYGDFSDARSFVVSGAVGPAAPALIQPTDDAQVGDTPTFIWHSVENAASYKIEIDDASDFSSTAVSEEVTDTTYTVATALTEGTYYWHVAAKDENDNYGDYSDAWSFEVTGGGLYEIVGRIDFESDYYPNKCMVSGNTVYMTAKEKGLVAIDVSNPSNPTELDIYNTEGVAWDVYINGNTAYVSDQTNGIVILDVTDPSDIKKSGEIKPGYDCRGVYVTGGYLYVTGTTGSDGIFLVYDLADTDTFLYKIEFTANAATEVCVMNNTAYISGGASSGKLWIYDVSDPEALVSLGDYSSDRGGGALNISLVGNTAYLSNWNQGLEILDVSDPANITRSGYYMSEPTNAVYEAKIDGNIAYVANSWGGLMIVDVSDPMNPEQLYNAKPQYVSLLGLDWAGNYVYCPDNGDKAFFIVKVK